jgi:hypothetical protein
MLFFSEVRAQSSCHGRSIIVGDTSNQKTNSNWMNMRSSPALFSIDERRCDRRRKNHASLRREFKENKPPLAGRDNQVGGIKEDQCSAFKSKAFRITNLDSPEP